MSPVQRDRAAEFIVRIFCTALVRAKQENRQRVERHGGQRSRLREVGTQTDSSRCNEQVVRLAIEDRSKSGSFSWQWRSRPSSRKHVHRHLSAALLIHYRYVVTFLPRASHL